MSAAYSEVPPKPLRISASCLATIQRFTRASGFSAKVVGSLGCSRRPSSAASYQSKWSVYHRWCSDTGHSVSNLMVSRWLTIFFSFGRLRSFQCLQAGLTAPCCLSFFFFFFKLPAFSEHHVLRGLIKSFALDRPRHPQLPSTWDLDVVLRLLMSAAYEPLESLSLRALTEKTLFLVTLANAKRVGELQALSQIVSSVVGDLVMSLRTFLIS